MLNKHFLHGRLGEGGVNQRAAFFVERDERLPKLRVAFLLRLDQFRQAPSKCRHLRFEFVNGVFPISDVRLFVFKEAFEDQDELCRVCQVCRYYQLSILIQHGACRRLEEDVALRIAVPELPVNLGGEVIIVILRFIEAAWDA